MPKDMPINELIEEAEEKSKQVAKFAEQAPVCATRLENGFKKDKPDLDWITQEIARDEKWLCEIETDLKRAEKTLKQLTKSKDAAAKKPAKELDDALEDAGKEIEKLRATMGIAEKIADKAEVEDKRLTPVMKQALLIAEERRKELSNDLITCPRIVQHLGDIVEKVQAGPMPIEMYESVLRVFVRDMKQIGGHLTSSDSVSSSLATLGTKGAKAFLPELRQLVEDCTTMKKTIDVLITKVRGEHAKGLKSAKEWHDSLADKLKKAA